MKNVILKVAQVFAAIVCLAGNVLAQNTKQTEGVISYELKINLHANLTKEQQAYKAMIPEFSNQSVKLYFKNGNYRIEEIEQEQSQSGGVSIVMSSGGSQAKIVRNDRNYVYTLYKKGEKTYYTVEKIVKPTITIDKKSVKKILNYECYKVLYKSAGETYEIWVTDALKLTASPMDGLNFGGTVLEINSKNLTYKAKKIEFVSQKDNLFDVSSEDKKITKEQAEDLQEQNIKDFERKAKK